MAPTAVEERLIADVTPAARGDQHAYGRLVDGTRNLVTAIALAIVRDVAASEDVAQEVYLHAWRGLGRLRNPASFLPWLRQLTRHRAHDELRRRGRRPVEPLAEDAHRDARPDACAQLIAGEEQAALAAALDELPEVAREVVTLFYREGRSVTQVAELLGLREPAVKKRLSRARAELRASTLERLGDFVERSAPAAAFTAAVLGAITAGAPAAAAAATLANAGKGSAAGAGKLATLAGKLGGASLAAKIAGAALGSLAGALGGSLGVWSGVQKQLRRTRDAEERRKLYLFACVNIACTIAGAVGIPLGNAWWRGPGIAIGFCFMWVPICWSYLVWLPRITARRRAAELAEDPTAAARQRREKRMSWVGLAFGTLAGWGAVLAAWWLQTP